MSHIACGTDGLPKPLPEDLSLQPLEVVDGVMHSVVTPELPLSKSKSWPKAGVSLKVAFIDEPEPPADLRARILSHMNAWSEFCKVAFVEDRNDPEVRITFKDKGYSSYVGKDILGIPKDEPTMSLQNFSMNTEESEFVRVVRHETGHTLGFRHEHLRAEVIKWIDAQKAIEYYAQRPNNWDEKTVRQNILTPLAVNDLLAPPEADVHSIMCYWLNPEVLKPNAPEIPGGRDFSEVDKSFAASIYPKFETNFTEVAPPNNVATDIVADGDHLYLSRRTGGVWSYLASQGWEELDANPKTVEILARNGVVYQRHDDGPIWMYTGVPRDWKPLDKNPRARALAATSNMLCQLHDNGEIWEYAQRPDDWEKIDANPRTVQLAGTKFTLYTRHDNGDIWMYTGRPNDWQHIDGNALTVEIVASHEHLYQRHNNGEIWVYTGSGKKWTRILGPSNTVKLFANKRQLYRVENNGDVWVYRPTLSKWDSEKLLVEPNTVKLAFSDNRLFQLQKNGRVLSYDLQK